MATTFTHKLESFFDNNTPGGYIQTSINITDSELDARINQKFQNQNYLTSTSMIPASQITGLSTVATSGRYSDLIGITGTNVSISNTLNEGTRIATITIDGISTDIYENTINNTEIITTETDPVFTNSPAARITANDINNWNMLQNNIDNLRGNPSGQGETLELLDQNKATIVYINTMIAPYNYTTFGTSSFWDKNTTLITDIINQLDSNKIIILITATGNWLITNYIQNIDIIYISIINLRSDNYFTVLTNVSNTVTKTEEETEEEYESRFNDAIINTLSDSFNIGMLIYDYNQQCSYFKFINIIDDINSRLAALEEGE